jgi:cell division protein FtsB
MRRLMISSKKVHQYKIMRILGYLRKKYLLYGLIFGCAFLVFMIFAGRGLMQINQLKEEREKAKVAAGKLQEENKKISRQIEKMKKNTPEEVERIAREELGLVKKGEIIYKFE